MNNPFRVFEIRRDVEVGVEDDLGVCVPKSMRGSGKLMPSKVNRDMPSRGIQSLILSL